MSVMRMTNKEAKTILVNLTYLFGDEEVLEALDVAISALSVIEQTKWERDTALATLEEHGIGLGQRAEPKDLISRAEAMNAFERGEVYHADTIADILSDLPSCHNCIECESVSAERVGEWIPKEDYGGFDYYQCSNCKEDFYFEIEPSKSEYHYCPNCGARMENTK